MVKINGIKQLLSLSSGSMSLTDSHYVKQGSDFRLQIYYH